MNSLPPIVIQLLFCNLFLPSSTWDTGADSIVSPCLTYKMGSILNLLLKWDTISGGKRMKENRTQNILQRGPREGVSSSFPAKQGPYEPGSENNVPWEPSEGGWFMPLPPLGETEEDNPRGSVQWPNPKPGQSAGPTAPRWSRLAACGLDLVPRYIMFGPQSLEKWVSWLPMFKIGRLHS